MDGDVSRKVESCGSEFDCVLLGVSRKAEVMFDEMTHASKTTTKTIVSQFNNISNQMKASQLFGLLSTSFTLHSSAFSLQTPPKATISTTTEETCINDDNMPKQFRSVRRVMERPYKHWVGDGFHVYPVFADLAFKEDLSPLLMFDYAAPKQFNAKVGQPRGVGQHPHRGFETVTISFQGEVEHGDNKGNNDIIGPGDVQWMTAGRGIVHEEFHSKNFTRNGGTFGKSRVNDTFLISNVCIF